METNNWDGVKITLKGIEIKGVQATKYMAGVMFMAGKNQQKRLTKKSKKK